jgi:predicted transcriptional regulator
MDWKKYGIVISSRYRQEVIKTLMQRPKTPKQISIETGLYLSHVSKTLNELSSLEIVTCLTPDLKRGRIYDLTKDGRDIASYLLKNKDNR